MVQRIWRQISPYWHIFTTILAAFIITLYWIHDVSGYGGRIAALEDTQTKQARTLTRMDYNIQIIARKIGVVPLRKRDGEDPE